MKIESIQAFFPDVGNRTQTIVKVVTDTGITGWGEAGVSGRSRAVAGAVDHYSQFLVGRDPLNRDALWQECYRSQYYEGGRILSAAIAAIDIALWDIAGKYFDSPVYTLLGGKSREVVPCFATAKGESRDELVSNCELLVREGWAVIRTGFSHGLRGEDGLRFEPRQSIAETADWLIEVRRAIGSGPVLGIDYHHRLTLPETVSFWRRMPPATLDFLEEPMRCEDESAYGRLRGLIDAPLAIGEEFTSKWDFRRYIESGLTDFVRVDICNAGGLTEAKKIAGMAEAHYLDLMPHNPLGPICTAATAHLATAIPNFAWLEIRESPTENEKAYDTDLFSGMPQLDGPNLLLSDSPGIGVEVNEDELSRRSVSWWEPPHLHRSDGSFTNW